MGRVLIPALFLAALLVLGAHPLAGAASDVWSNVGPAPQVGDGGIAGRYPLTNYSLDQHFDAVSASLTGGVDVSGVPPMIAYFLASILWLLTSFLASLLITLFTFAFSLDLVTGSEATGGAGALAPVSRAIHAIYSDVFGAPWLVLAIAVAGCWAMWKALVQRRYSETAGALGLSLIYVVAALFFVAQPGTTIGGASKWTNQMSGAFLSIASHGSPSSARQAKEDTANQLFDLLVFRPWVVLEFGGLEHCVRAGTGDGDSDPESVAVRPLSTNPDRDAALGRRLRRGTEVTADGKACVNNASKYAPRFLRHGPGDDERDDEYEALNDGDASGLPDAERSGYRLGVADRPATDAMEEGGQYQRLLLALVLFVGELGAFLLLGSLAIGIILAQVLLLLLLAFGPVALVAAAIPGRGHDFFKGWLQKLAGFLLRKAAYSLILAILLAVNGALAGATAQLGWLMSFGLQSLFFWAVFLQRKTLADSLVGIATGPGAPGREGTLRVLGVYAGARMGGRALAPLRRAGRFGGRGARRHFGGGRGGGGADPDRPRRAPLLGTSDGASVGDGRPALDAPRQDQQPRPATRDEKLARRAAEPAARASAAATADSPPAHSTAPKSVGRRRRKRKATSPETPPREAGQEKKGKATRVPQRERKQPAARPPLREDTAAPEPRESLADELRAERERGAKAPKEGPPREGDKPDSARQPAPRKRKRHGRNGDSR